MLSRAQTILNMVSQERSGPAMSRPQPPLRTGSTPAPSGSTRISSRPLSPLSQARSSRGSDRRMASRDSSSSRVPKRFSSRRRPEAMELSREEELFREEVRAFFAAELTPELRRAGKLMTSVYADHDAQM